MLELKEEIEKIELGIEGGESPDPFKNNRKLRELSITGIFNPRFTIEREHIELTKQYRSAVYNLPFLFRY
ncbi:MAG: hypothetical protein ACFFA3_14880 [Promethearchaeota archaeon]